MDSPTIHTPTEKVGNPRSSLPLIHRFYILLKGHYFLFFSAFGMLYPVLNLTLRGRGLSNIELSYINIIIPFLVFLMNPIMGFIADRTRRYLSTFNIALAIITTIYIIMFFLPSVKSHNIKADVFYDDELGRVLDFCASQEVATKCASRSQCGCSYQANCSLIDPLEHKNTNHMKPIFFIFSMNSTKIYKEVKDASEPAACGIEYRVPIDDAYKQYIQNQSFDPFPHTDSPSRLATCDITCSIAHYCHGPRYTGQLRFILFYSLIFVVGTSLINNAISLGASIGFATLHRPDIFGQQRVYGTIGFGISAFVASRLYGLFQTEFVYIIMFSITCIICIFVTSFIRIQPSKTKHETTFDNNIDQDNEMDDYSEKKITKTKKKQSKSKLSELLPLLKNFDVIIFLSLAFIWGMSYGVLDPYLFLYIDEIAPCQSRSIVGWMSLVSAASEVISLFIAGKVLKLLGTNLSSVLILLAFAVRFGGYYYIRQPYFLIFMETLQFFNFGILYVLIAQKADAIAPPGLSGTLQGVCLGLLFGFGRGSGLLISSFIYTLIQQRLLFLIASLFNVVAAIIYSLYFIINRQRSKKVIEKNNINKNTSTMMTESTDARFNEEPLLLSSLNTNKPNY